MTDTDIEVARIADLHLEVRIAGSREHVWTALTEDIARWWPRAFYCGGGSLQQHVTHALVAPAHARPQPGLRPPISRSVPAVPVRTRRGRLSR